MAEVIVGDRPFTFLICNTLGGGNKRVCEIGSEVEETTLVGSGGGWVWNQQ